MTNSCRNNNFNKRRYTKWSEAKKAREKRLSLYCHTCGKKWREKENENSFDYDDDDGDDVNDKAKNNQQQ